MDAPWLRVSPAIRQFVLGEVERQYHPIGTFEYRERVEWMTDAWTWAQKAADDRRPTVEDVLFLAARIEPVLNLRGFRTADVWIGGHAGADPRDVPARVERLWSFVDQVLPEQGRAPSDEEMTADDFYLEFEDIHPFADGNGRVGKVLHNWLLGTLDNPVLVYDYFGGGNP